MSGNRDANGHFAKGNKIGPGRPKGARNRGRAYPFIDESDVSAPARRFRGLMHRMVDDLGGVETLSAGQQQLLRNDLGRMRIDGERGHIRAASQRDRLRHAYRPPDLEH